MDDFSLGSGFSGIDLSTITAGSDQAVAPDVSYGGPAEQPTDPTGNGYGTYIFGTLDKALNYALARDQMQMKFQQQQPVLQIQQARAQVAQKQAGNTSLLLLLAGAAGLIMLAK